MRMKPEHSLALNFPALEAPQRLAVLIQLAPCGSVQAEVQDVVVTLKTHISPEACMPCATVEGRTGESVQVTLVATATAAEARRD